MPEDEPSWGNRGHSAEPQPRIAPPVRCLDASLPEEERGCPSWLCLMMYDDAQLSEVCTNCLSFCSAASKKRREAKGT